MTSPSTAASPLKLVNDIGVVFGREIRPELRNPAGMVFTMIQPLIFLGLFGPLLTGTPGVGSGSPWLWFVPGILVMQGLFATSSAGYTLLLELGGGSMERLLVTPLNRTSMLVGRTLKDVLTFLVQSVLIVVVMLPFGFAPDPLGVLVGLALMVLFGIGVGALSFSLAIASRKSESMFYVVHQTVLFPLLLTSGVLLPMDSAPGWLRGVSDFNPLSYVVQAERALFIGNFGVGAIFWGFLAALALAAVGLAVGTRAIRRATL